MGRVVTSALLDYCQDCDAALYNSGGIRASINLADLKGGNSERIRECRGLSLCLWRLSPCGSSRVLVSSVTTCSHARRRSQGAALPEQHGTGACRTRADSSDRSSLALSSFPRALSRQVTMQMKGALLIDMLAWSITKRGAGAWLQLGGVR